MCNKCAKFFKNVRFFVTTLKIKETLQTLLNQGFERFFIVLKLTQNNIITPSEGIEPPVQEPESYVLSITPRGQKTQKKSTHPRLTKSMM